MSETSPPRSSVVAAVAALGLALAGFAGGVDDRVLSPLTAALACAAVVANLMAVRYDGSMWVSASFTCSMIAVAALGPAAAFAVAALGELGAWLFERIRLYALAGNVLAAGVPNLVAGAMFAVVAPVPLHAVTVSLVLAPIAALALVLSFAIARTLSAPSLGEGLRASLHPPSPLAPALLWAVIAAAGVADLYVRMPAAGAAGLALVIVGITYMLQLVAASRQRRVEQQGLAGDLLRSLQARDAESARHAAAVATFAGRIAAAMSLSADAQRAAHTAGLVHDLGRLSLSDVALGASGDLNDSEWAAIQRHPEAGAAMLRTLGFDDDVVRAVAAHHERVDGRGYPLGLDDAAIPVLAKIVAVAEVYDTITSGSSYRPGEGMSSFQALTELRRVSGSQLDPECVEALASVLADRPAEERLATRADFDAELALLGPATP